MFWRDFSELSYINRKESCSFCDSTEAKLVSKVDYWDLLSTNIVQCQKCRHMELDPKLNGPVTEKGCKAYFLRERANIHAKEQLRNLVRNFRKGVVFAYQLKNKNILPDKILEIGPGTGFFSSGIHFVFPDADITVMDIVDEVLQDCKRNHGFSTIKAFPDNKSIATGKKFDLIIARDLIEHVNKPAQLLKNVNNLLAPKGYFHFITPNGYQDVWGHYIQWKLNHSNSELLINHVNYFDGQCLFNYLNENGFHKIKYYTYHVKEHLRGKGWQYKLNWSQKSEKLSANRYLKSSSLELPPLTKKEVFNQWFISSKYKWFTFVYSLYHHHFWLHINPKRNIGHEIFGLFQKK